MHNSIVKTSNTQHANMQDARPSFMSAAFAGLENTPSLQNSAMVNGHNFRSWMASIENSFDRMGVTNQPSAWNKRVKVATNGSDSIQLNETEMEHAFAFAEARSKWNADDELVSALTAAFEESSIDGDASSTAHDHQQPLPTPQELQHQAWQGQQGQQQQQSHQHSPHNPFYQDNMTLAWAATNIVAYFQEASSLLADWHATQDPSAIAASTLKRTSTFNRMWANAQWTLEFLTLGRQGFCLLEFPDEFFAHVLPLVEDTVDWLGRVSRLRDCGSMVRGFRTVAVKVGECLVALKNAREAQGKADWVKGVWMSKGDNWTG